MVFRARIRRHSAIWRLWHGQARTGGVLYDIPFRFIEGGDYETDALTTTQVMTLEPHPDTELVVHGHTMADIEDGGGGGSETAAVPGPDDAAGTAAEPRAAPESGIPEAPRRPYPRRRQAG